MGNQQFEAQESQSNISQYYQKILNQNKENIPCQNTPKLMKSESKNKLKPTSKINLDMKLCSRSSEKQLFDQNIPQVRNPLEKLQRKRSSTKIVHENDDSHIQLLDLLKNMVRHQDSTMQSSQTKITEQSCQEYDKKKTILNDNFMKLQTPQEDRPMQFFNRKRSKTFEESFRTLVSCEDRCQPLKTLHQESKEEEALQFLLQNCTQTQSRIDQQNSITFESLESDWQALTKKNSKQLETPGTAQFQGFNKDDKIFELSTSNFIESHNDDIIGSRKPSCMESAFLIPMVLHSQNSLEFDDVKEILPNYKPQIKLNNNIQLNKQKQSINKQINNGLYSQQQSQATIKQLLKVDNKCNSTTTRDIPIINIEKKKISQSLTSGLPNKAPLKHKSLHQKSDYTLQLPLQIVNQKGNQKSNQSFVQNIPQPSCSSKGSKSPYDSRQLKTIVHPEEQWLNNSKLEFKKIMLILDDQQQVQNFSIQNKSEMISNTFNSSEINCSQIKYDDISYKIKPQFSDKNTQTQLKDLQKDFLKRLSQPKSRCNSIQNTNPYWKIREVDQSKRSKRK